MILTPAAIAAAARGDLKNALVAATPGGIERQEKEGQIALVQSTNMPVEMNPSRAEFEAVGFTFGDPVDELFLSANLPDGWKREVTDHPMWSKIVDAKGRERVVIFYKAAFYDRKAHAHLKCRYTIVSTYRDGTDGTWDRTAETVCDAGAVIQSFAVPPRPTDADSSYGSAYWYARRAVENEAEAWLNERFPDNRNPVAYWD